MTWTITRRGRHAGQHERLPRWDPAGRGGGDARERAASPQTAPAGPRRCVRVLGHARCGGVDGSQLGVLQHQLEPALVRATMGVELVHSTCGATSWTTTAPSACPCLAPPKRERIVQLRRTAAGRGQVRAAVVDGRTLRR